MELLDKIYLNIFWSVNNNINAKKTTIWVLNYLLFPLLSGLLVMVISCILFLISFKIDLKILIGMGLAISFFLSEKLIDIYYTNIKQIEIINNNNKPGVLRYVVFVIVILTSLFIMMASFFITGIIIHLY